MNIDNLLKEVNLISANHDKNKKNKGVDFNIFEVLKVSTDEVKICRILFELLNPKGSHNNGDLYLKHFIEDVLKMKNFNYKNVIVHREYLLKSHRRIDIVIENETHFIPIEVKINAEDQELQCFDYYKVAKNSNVYYLTLFGHTPTEYSAKGLTSNGSGYNEVTEISFEKNILDWLEKCLHDSDTKKSYSIAVIIEQLIETIKTLTNQRKKEKYMDIKKILQSSSENVQGAFAIEKSLKLCKIEMLKKVFSALEAKLKEKNMTKLESLNFWDYKDNRTDSFYDVNAKRPGISYLIKENIKTDVDLVFRIEIYENIYCGFCTPYKNKRDGNQIIDVKDLLKVEPLFEDWWIYYEYLPSNSIENTINFRYPKIDDVNSAYLSLYDDVKFDLFINNCVANIEKVLGFVK